MGGILHFLRGEVTADIECAEPERILNICALNGVNLGNARRLSPTCLRFTTDSRGFNRLRLWSRTEGFELSAQRSRGGPYLRKRIKRRWLISALLLLALSLSWFSTLFIWQLDVTGNETVGDGAILAELRALGVDTGTFVQSVDSEALAYKMLSALPELQWFAINITGSRAHVLVRERVKRPVVYDMDEPIMVYAKKAGVITKIEALSGRALYSVGDAVPAGETLVTGIMESPTAKTRLVRALADVYASTKYSITAVLPLSMNEMMQNGETKTLYTVNIAKKDVNFYFNSRISWLNYVKINSINQAVLPTGAMLPFWVEKTVFERCELQKRELEETEAEGRLEEYLMRTLEERINGRVTEAKLEYTVADGVMTGTLNAVCEELISAERPFTESELNITTEETETQADG